METCSLELTHPLNHLSSDCSGIPRKVGASRQLMAIQQLVPVVVVVFFLSGRGYEFRPAIEVGQLNL